MRVLRFRSFLYVFLAVFYVITQAGGSCDAKIPADLRQRDCYEACGGTCGFNTPGAQACLSGCLSSGEVNCGSSSSSSSPSGKHLPK